MNKVIKKYLEETMIFVKGGKCTLRKAPSVGEITLESYSLSKFPVTQELYEWVIGYNPSYFKGKNRPVEMVSWYNAIEFCNKLSEILGLNPFYIMDKEKKDRNNLNIYKDDSKKWLIEINEKANGYRLPSEAEWEFAAIGGNLNNENFDYAGSNNIDEVGWQIENSQCETKGVGIKKPNQLGLYDMSGNVKEWCWGWYEPEYLEYIKIDPKKGAVRGDMKLVRGGSWDDYSFNNFLSYRFRMPPDIRENTIGFRIAKSGDIQPYPQ